MSLTILSNDLHFMFYDSETQMLRKSHYNNLMEEYKGFLTKKNSEIKVLLDLLLPSLIPKKIEINVITTFNEILCEFFKNTHIEFLSFLEKHVKKGKIITVDFSKHELITLTVNRNKDIGKVICDLITDNLSLLKDYKFSDEINDKVSSLIVTILVDYKTDKEISKEVDEEIDD